LSRARSIAERSKEGNDRGEGWESLGGTAQAGRGTHCVPFTRASFPHLHRTIHAGVNAARAGLLYRQGANPRKRKPKAEGSGRSGGLLACSPRCSSRLANSLFDRKAWGRRRCARGEGEFASSPRPRPSCPWPIVGNAGVEKPTLDRKDFLKQKRGLEGV
jgi:hypothetical protein